jgi:hypothetical protein
MVTVYGLPSSAPAISIPGLPGPDSKDNRYRFYACELKWNAWQCRQQPDTSLWEQSPGTLLTSIIPVNKLVPQVLDRFVVASKLQKPVVIKE